MPSQQEIVEKYWYRFPPENRGIECGAGWNWIIDEFLEKLDFLDKQKEIVMFVIKEKFGGLRIQGCGCSDELYDAYYDLVYKYERMSNIVCEKCSAVAKQINIFGFIATVCPVHEKELRSLRKQ